MPLVVAGDDIAALLVDGAQRSNLKLRDGDVIVIAQKIVSKAEGRLIQLDLVSPSKDAIRLAEDTEKDPRVVELILRESTRIVRQERNLIITETGYGLVMANAGIDQSNVDSGCALLLPKDPDQSASQIRNTVHDHLATNVGVIIADSIGRAWRRGIVGHAIGVAGVESVVDLRESRDLFGRKLKVTEIAIADEIAAAATLLMGQGREGIPFVLVRGFGTFDKPTDARSIIRSKDMDLFR